ncbi:unnamed protein product [Schistosoma margrebowiei]|uniref:Uncharacterized protein n=1 Tax=Schistosoma margrebowiei TaxID=48269 RepID=A0A183MT04_9TREM|nr:unnamed protein product [Schistosoma margrebowiei]
MTILPDQLQLLLDRQQQRFREIQLNVLDYLRTRLLNLPCFGDVKEVDGLISHLLTELENDCRTYEYENKSLYESLMISNANDAVAHDLSSDPEVSDSKACPVEDLLLNAHKLITVTSHNETGNKSCSILSLAAPNGPHHSTTGDSDESYYLDPLVPENVLDAPNDGQKFNTILIDVNYPSDQLSTNDVFKEFNDNVPEESNVDDFISSDVGPHYLITFSDFSVPCDNRVFNKLKLILTWGYKDSTLFRGRGRTQKILKSGYQLRILKKEGEVMGCAETYTNSYHVKSNVVLGC